MVVLFAWKFWSAYRSPQQLRRIAEAIRDGAPLIDVRTAVEYAAGHLPHSVSLPLGSFSPDTEALGDKRGPLVVYCASGMRSGRAAKMLRKAGFENVLDLGPLRNARKLPTLEAPEVG